MDPRPARLSQPFVLLDDARVQGGSPARLYRDPVRCLSAHTAEELDQLLDELRRAGRGGEGQASLTPARPEMAEHDYAARFALVHEAIARGDIYQANLTFQNHAAVSGHPLALYRALRAGSAAGYGGVVFDGADWQLSLSPEMFFSLRQGEMTARPMKG